MHILDCHSPLRIYNKYTKEFQYVPCGKCPSCLRSRANKWIERLNVERKCWKYCLFYTLTYSDLYVPRLSKLGDDYLADLTHLHQAPGTEAPVIYLPDVYRKCTEEEAVKLRSFLSKQDSFTYLSVYDSQCFIKRLRKNLSSYIKKAFTNYVEKDYQIRYYAIGEYGSTTKRAHYHGLLFFSSEKTASCIEEVLRKSWKFGLVDTSFVSDSNASYLAKYLNCTSDLPKIYESKNIRPFAHYSKQPPIGTLYFNDEEVRKIFDSASPTHLVDYFKGVSLVNAPIWRTYQDRLFPKIAHFSRFSHFDRTKLYRASVYYTEKFGEQVGASDFAHFMLGHYGEALFSVHYLKVYHDYIDTMLSYRDVDIIASLMRWYNVSKRVATQAAAFDVSVEYYVGQIEKYYNNVEYEKIKLQMGFEENFAELYGPQSLIGIDKLYLESLLDTPLELMTFQEQTTLQSYGIDIKKFTSDDLSERLEYQSLLLPENTRDYANVVKDSLVWLKKATKTKVKNDYLAERPDLQYKYGDLI